MLIRAPFKNPSSRSNSVVYYLDVFCTVIDVISVCGSIPIEIPILWPRAVMVGPKPRVLPTLPLLITTYNVRHHTPNQYNQTPTKPKTYDRSNVNADKVKQSRYRPGVAQRVPGS